MSILKSQAYFTSSKTTYIDYQCVSTGCCSHVAKTEKSIQKQHVTKSMQRYRFLPKQPKENTEKIINLMIFLILIGYRMLKWQWNGKWRKTCHIALLIIVPVFPLESYQSLLHCIYILFKKNLGSLPTLPRIFLKTLLFDEVPYIGYQTDNICYYWNCPKGCRSCKKLHNVRN